MDGAGQLHAVSDHLPKAMKICEERIKRLGNLPKWEVAIETVSW